MDAKCNGSILFIGMTYSGSRGVEILCPTWPHFILDKIFIFTCSGTST